MRNEVGGHFLDAAAKRALETINEPGTLEVRIAPDRSGAWVECRFAHNIVAWAVTRDGSPRYYEEMLSLLMEWVKHANNCVHLIAVYWLIPRFQGAS